jgi:hypothetical protein
MRATPFAPLRRTAIVVLLAALSTAAGCRQEQTPAPDAAPASASALPASSGLEAFVADAKAPLTPAIAEQLLLGLVSCKMGERDIQRGCDALDRLNRARSHRFDVKDRAGGLRALGKKHLGDPSPAVRLESAKLCAPSLGSDAEAQKLLMAQASKEKVPAVLLTMLRVLGSADHPSADLGKLLLSKVDDESAPVRMEAMGWMLTGVDTPGGFDRVLDKVDKDPSLEVRSYLCTRLYGTADARALPIFEKYLRAKDTPKKLYEGCFRGLVSAWTGFPKPKKPAEKAYRLTLELLDAKPRDNDRPPYSAIALLRAAKTKFGPTDTGGKAWLEEVKGWYDAKRLLAALESLAGDHDASLLARTSALDVMKELGAKKAAFSRVAARYAKATGQDENLKRRVDQIVKSL